MQYGKWRCIEASECKNKTTIFHAETINQRRPYKIYGGKCLEFCPPTTEEVMSPDGFWTCEVSQIFDLLPAQLLIVIDEGAAFLGFRVGSIFEGDFHLGLGWEELLQVFILDDLERVDFLDFPEIPNL